MAAKGFEETSCEDCHSSTSSLFYRVSVSELLCDECADRKKDRILGTDEPVTLPCKHHDTLQGRVFCRSHGAWFCLECAFKFHQRPCEAFGIKDEISKRMEELSKILTDAKAKKDELETLGETTQQRLKLAQENLASLQGQISTACEEEQKKVGDEETEMVAEITGEAEEKIRRINEEKNKKLRLVTEKATLKRQFIKEGNEKLQRSINRVGQAVQSRSDEMNSCWLKSTSALDHSINAAEAMAGQERYQENDFYEVASSLHDSTKTDVDTSRIEQIASLASEVSFCRRDGPILGKLYASKEKWEMAYEFYPSKGRIFEMKGSLDQDEVLLRDISSGKVKATSLKGQCIIDIETKNIERIFSCTSFQERWIICGTKDGTIVIYNTTWKHLRTINVTKKHRADILVSVERNGFILAAVKSESTIHLYNPDDGKLVRSIAVTDCLQIQEMQALSSGCIAVRTQCSEGPDVSVLQNSGTVLLTHHFHGKTVHGIAVDQVSDAIYVMNSDRGHVVIHVIQTQDAIVTELTEIMRVTLNPAWCYQTCIIPEAGTFVICHYGKLLVYKRVSTNQQLSEVLFTNAIQDIYV